MLYLSALETLHVEALYKSTTFTFMTVWSYRNSIIIIIIIIITCLCS